MKRILFVITSLGGGGAEKVLVTLVNQLCNKNYNINLLIIYGDGVYEKAVDNRVNLKIVFKHKSSSSKFIGKLYLLRSKILGLISGKWLHKLWVKEHFDYEIAYVEGIATKIVSGNSDNSKKLAWVHCNQEKLTYSTASYRSLNEEIKAYKVFDEVYCVSDDIKLAFERKYGRNAKVIRNAIDSKNILELSSRESLSANEHTDSFRIVTVGRLAPIKGFDRLLRVIKKCIIAGMDIQLEIIGTGELEEELKELTKTLDIEEYVIWRGFTTNPYKYMVTADLYVCSSLSEGYSTSVIESLILGIPVLTTDCPGMREIFGAYGCGLIVENSEDGLFLGLSKIINDGKVYDELKKQARIRGEAFNIEQQIEEFEENVLK